MNSSSMTGTGNSSFGQAVPVDSCGWPLTQRPPPHPLRYLDLCTYPFLLQLTTLGNILNLLVLRREKPFGSKGVYLSALAITDLTYMWNAIVIYISNYDGEINGRPRPIVRYFVDRLTGVTLFLQETCVILSAWLIVAFTLERFLAIRYPMKHLNISHGKRSIWIVIGLAGVAIAITTARLVDYYWFYANFLAIDPKPKRQPNRPAALKTLYQTYSWAMAVIPTGTFLAILMLNLLLTRIIIRRHHIRRESLHVTSSSSAREKDRGTVAMLLACAVAYLITQTPGFVGNILELLERTCVTQTKRTALFPVLNVLLNINFSINFLLYCGANPRFRRAVKKLLRIRWYDRRKSLSQSTRSQSLISKQCGVGPLQACLFVGSPCASGTQG